MANFKILIDTNDEFRRAYLGLQMASAAVLPHDLDAFVEVCESIDVDGPNIEHSVSVVDLQVAARAMRDFKKAIAGSCERSLRREIRGRTGVELPEGKLEVGTETKKICEHRTETRIRLEVVPEDDDEDDDEDPDDSGPGDFDL